MSKKILFIKTPSTNFIAEKTSLKGRLSAEVPMPLGLCYLGSLFRNEGYEVEIFDPHIEFIDEFNRTGDVELLKDGIRRRVARTDYDFLGIASQFLYTYRWGHYIAEQVKAVNPAMPVIIGGGHPSLISDEVIKDENIDYVIIGEGERTMLSLVRYLESGEDDLPEDVDGLCYRRGGEVVCRPKSTFIDEVDELPFPAWDLLDINRYMDVSIRMISYGKRSLPVITSRGCPYSCTFCNSFESWGRKFRTRSAANILAEVDHLIERYGIEDVLFVDDNMTVNKERMMEITQGLKERPISWGLVNISSFTTDEEMLVAMKESGCTNLSISIESAVPEVLKALRKPVDLVWSKELVRICRRVGLRCSLNFITGLPHETKEDMLRTCEYATEIRGDWNTFSVLVPYPGTDIYRFCVDKGYLNRANLDMDHLTQRHLQIETEHWDRRWVQELTYDINIKVNFLYNYNLVEDDGRPEWAMSMFRYVASNHPEHAVAFLCLGYGYHRQGQAGKSEEALRRARTLLEDDSVYETFGKYLEWDEKVVRFYKDWLASQALPAQ